MRSDRRTRRKPGPLQQRVFGSSSLIESLERRTLFAAVTLPSATGLEFQTNGQSRPPTIGDWYTTASSASTDRAHYALIQVTADMLTAGSGTVTITVNDAESATGAGPLDEVQGTQDPTRFALLQSDRSTVISSTTVPSGSANGTAVAFNVTTAGTYFVQSVTGAQPISGDATPDLNDDDNAYTITVSQSGGLLGIYQGSFQQATVANRDLFFIVAPGTTSLLLRNFDLDGATVTYTRPSGATIAGTSSGDGLWNGSSPTLDTGGDTITGLTTADVGIWKVTLSGVGVGNQTIFEANTGDGQRIVLLDAAPPTAGNFSISNSGTRSTRLNVPVDHVFTVTNQFATNDAINLTTSGTSAGFTAVLLDDSGNPLTDTTGDGIVDTGTLTPGQSKTLRLRVTPTSGTATTDVTQVDAVSFLDTTADSGSNTTRSITLTTGSNEAPSIANAIIDCGFLRSRNATLTGQIAAGDPGTHRVRINWGDGKVDFVDLANGETNFTAKHRFRHDAKCQAKLTVVDEQGLSSAPFKAITRSEATVIQVFNDVLVRDPTAAELRKYSRRLDRCRSASALDVQAAKLASELKA